MKIYSVNDPEFAEYGSVHSGYDTRELAAALESLPLPEGTGYVASEPTLENTDIFGKLRDNAYGGMPVQLGWCSGHNTRLNCLEYHRDSEFNIGATDFILLLAKRCDIRGGVLDTKDVKAFRAEAGQVVEVFATSMHYAPCQTKADGCFRVAILLPLGTNGEKPDAVPVSDEDKMLYACNKWLLAHPDSDEARAGACVAIRGENIDLRRMGTENGGTEYAAF